MCRNFKTVGDHNLLRVTPTKNYQQPTALRNILNEDIKNHPFQLSCEKLQKAVVESHDRFLDGSWTKKNVKCYLWNFGINNESINNILDHAMNAKFWKTVQEQKSTMTAQHQIILNIS
jgi:hypothetical protein